MENPLYAHVFIHMCIHTHRLAKDMYVCAHVMFIHKHTRAHMYANKHAVH